MKLNLTENERYLPPVSVMCSVSTGKDKDVCCSLGMGKNDSGRPISHFTVQGTGLATQSAGPSAK